MKRAIQAGEFSSFIWWRWCDLTHPKWREKNNRQISGHSLTQALWSLDGSQQSRYWKLIETIQEWVSKYPGVNHWSRYDPVIQESHCWIQPVISALKITGGTYLLISHLAPVASDTRQGWAAAPLKVPQLWEGAPSASFNPCNHPKRAPSWSPCYWVRHQNSHHGCVQDNPPDSSTGKLTCFLIQLGEIFEQKY